MKKCLLFIITTAIIAVMFAACNNKPASASVTFVDTTGLAQFQAWKAMNEKATPVQPIVAAATTVKKKTSAVKNPQSGSMNSLSVNEAHVAKKKGWSKAATYSAIGGGTGIALGAIFNKENRLVGGAVGGAVLGGLGYLIGHSEDKKDGRY